jgi:hypothetical protein
MINEPLDNILAKWDAWASLERALIGDINELIDRFEREPESQTLRRALVRGVWGYKEGCTNGICDFLAIYGRSLNSALSENVTKRTKTLALIKVALKRVAEIGLTPGWQPDFSQVRWRSLRKSYSYRNRLMHPKFATDITLSDNEAQETLDGLRWFTAAMVDLRTRALSPSSVT